MELKITPPFFLKKHQEIFEQGKQLSHGQQLYHFKEKGGWGLTVSGFFSQKVNICIKFFDAMNKLFFSFKM